MDTSPTNQYCPSFNIEFEKDSIVKTLNKPINPSQNTNPFNHNWSYIKLYTSMKDGPSDKDEFGQFINARYLDDVFNFATNLPVLTQIVRVRLGKKDHLHMREVQVFDYSDVNRAQGKTATQSSNRIVDGQGPKNALFAVDGTIDAWVPSSAVRSFSETNADDGKYQIEACKNFSQVSCII
jgi:hypothetical protein